MNCKTHRTEDNWKNKERKMQAQKETKTKERTKREEREEEDGNRKKIFKVSSKQKNPLVQVKINTIK